VEIESPDRKAVTPDLSPSERDLDIDYVNRRLGLELREKDVKRYLEMMGFGYKEGRVSVPAYRADILHQCDFVEDIAIAYGYENFEEDIPNVSTIGHESEFEIFKRKVAEILMGSGLLEINTYHIASEDNQTSMMESDIDVVKLANALNEEYNVMRAWMIPSVMEIYSQNRHHEYPQDLFDIGVTFAKDDSKETGVREDTRLAVSLCSERADFTRIKQIFDYLMRQIDLEYEISEVEHPSFIPGRVARISVGGRKVAYIGEIAPAVLENFELQMPVAAFELNLSELFDSMKVFHEMTSAERGI
jgi:phenylalanyl-tRNA synthetase beta chain